MTLLQFGEASCGRSVAEGAMASGEVVVGEPAWEGGGALGGGAVDRSVGPATRDGLDEALGLAVGAGPVGAGEQVSDLELVAGLGVSAGAIAGAVVAEHALDGDAHRREPDDRALEEAGGCRSQLVRQLLGIGEPGGVVDADMQELPARRAAPLRPGLDLRAPIAGDPVAGAALADPPQLLDVDVDELARSLALVAVRRL